MLNRQAVNYRDQVRSAAAKELRRRLDLSQSAFGLRIGRTLNTVLRYESQIEPRGEALLPYAALSIRCGYADLAEVFRSALLEDFGPDLEVVVSWQPGDTSSAMHIPHDMRPLVEAFVDFMLAKNSQPPEELARNSLRQLLLSEYSRAWKASRDDISGECSAHKQGAGRKSDVHGVPMAAEATRFRLS